MSNWYIIPKEDDLMHFGILGMKWGVRRFQNPDGTLTLAGKQRYNNYSGEALDKAKNKKDLNRIVKNDKERKRAAALAAESEENKKLLKSKGIKQERVVLTYNDVPTHTYTKEMGNTTIASYSTSEDPSVIVKLFDVAEKNKRDWSKEAANIVINDEFITNLYKQYIPGDSIGELKKVINKSDIIIDVAPFSKGSTDKISVGVVFLADTRDPKSAIFGDHILTVEGRYDTKNKKLLLENGVAMDG